MVKITGFARSQTINKPVNKAANDSGRVSGQDRKFPQISKGFVPWLDGFFDTLIKFLFYSILFYKKPSALGTNKIAGFGRFRPLASSEKSKGVYSR